jgi:lysophospholipase L1-like esterase
MASRRIMAGLLAVCAVVTAVVVAASVARADDALRLMVVGDSISQGFDGDYTWRYRLWQHLRADGSRVDFVGPRTGTHSIYAGGSSRGRYRVTGFDQAHDALFGRRLVEEKNTIKAEVKTYRPAVLLVQLGINDLQSGAATPVGLRDSMAAFIARVRSVRPSMRFVIGTVTERTSLPYAPGLTRAVAVYNRLLARLVADRTTARSPIVLADPCAAFNPVGDTKDGLHPNDLGEYVIAAAYARALSRGLGIGTPYRTLPSRVPALALAKPAVRVERRDGASLLTWSHVYGASDYVVWGRREDAPDRRVRLAGRVRSDHVLVGKRAGRGIAVVQVQAMRGTAPGPLSAATALRRLP